jgi:hypothetical protein
VLLPTGVSKSAAHTVLLGDGVPHGHTKDCLELKIMVNSVRVVKFRMKTEELNNHSKNNVF